MESAFAYLRVSTRKQDTENQKLQITNYCKSHDIAIGENDWFVDEAKSGTVAPMERESFRDMVEYIQTLKNNGERLPAKVLVYEVSRLGRTFYEIIDVMRVFDKDIGIPLIATSPKEQALNIEEKSLRKAVFSFLAVFAEMEREHLVQRTIEGLERARGEDRHIGNVPLGYDIHRCEVGKCIKDPRDQCPEHGKLSLTTDGRTVLDMLSGNPNLKPRQLRNVVRAESDYQRFALIRNVKKFGEGSPSIATYYQSKVLLSSSGEK